jgi:predicted ATPase
VIRRLYINNFRCLENFDLPIGGNSSVLLIGKNGSGKTTVGRALEILQKIARGTNRVGELVKAQDFARGRTDTPIRFEIDIELDKVIYGYSIAFEFPVGFRELRVFQEKLTADGRPVFLRDVSKVHLAKAGQENAADFVVDWHLVALPIIQQQSSTDPISILKQWIARMLLLRPIPSLMNGDSTRETLEPNPHVTDYGEWFSGVLAHAPAAYGQIERYLKDVMPDFLDIKNPVIGSDSRSLRIQFANEATNLDLPFAYLSDGEKCFMICALVLAGNSAYGPLFCFWDEPDNYLHISEVGQFVLALRRNFQGRGQFVATSHNSEAIRRFSNENTLWLHRRSHLEPTIVRPLQDLNIKGDLMNALIRDDVEG